MTSRQQNLFWTLVWLCIPFGALALFWSLRIRPIYVEEQFSELSTSAWMFHPHFLGWFTKPFSLYRMDYPEWNVLYRSFIRPTECLHYYLLSLVFGSHYSAYLMANYFYQAVTCSLTFYIAAEILRLDRRLAHALAFLVFVSPAYGQQQTFLISFAVDPMAGFLVLASVAFFLRQRFVWAWILIAFAVGAKEPAWPIPIVMALIILLAVRKRLSLRLWMGSAFVSLTLAMIALRAYAFGVAGALTSDEGAAPGPSVKAAAFARLFEALEKWPFGVLAHSQQYAPRVLATFRFWGYTMDAIFWVTLFVFMGRSAYRLLVSHTSLRELNDRLRVFLGNYGFATGATVALAAGSLIFPLRFTGDPRYGAPTYPLIFLTLAIVLAQRTAFWTRFVSFSLLVSIGIYGLVLRISDATHGRDVFRAEWQLVAGYRQAIADAGSHPLFVVDDATGGEINSEAIQEFYGPQSKVIRINDVFKEHDCLLMPDGGDLPLHLAVTAQRTSDHSVSIHSVITGCGSHNFLGVPRLPAGPLVRSDLGFWMRYTIDPRSSPQPTEGKPRVLDVTLENAPADAIIVAPDFQHRTYKVVPVSPAVRPASQTGNGEGRFSFAAAHASR